MVEPITASLSQLQLGLGLVRQAARIASASEDVKQRGAIVQALSAFPTTRSSSLLRQLDLSGQLQHARTSLPRFSSYRPLLLPTITPHSASMCSRSARHCVPSVARTRGCSSCGLSTERGPSAKRKRRPVCTNLARSRSRSSWMRMPKKGNSTPCSQNMATMSWTHPRPDALLKKSSPSPCCCPLSGSRRLERAHGDLWALAKQCWV